MTARHLALWVVPVALLAATCVLGWCGAPTWVGVLAALTTGVAGTVVDDHIRTQQDIERKARR